MKSKSDNKRCYWIPIFRLQQFLGSFILLLIFFLVFNCNSFTVFGFLVNRRVSASKAWLKISQQNKVLRKNNTNNHSNIKQQQREQSSFSSLSLLLLLSSSSNNNYGEQIIESIQSMVDFHEGIWIGKSVRSWTITDDVVAGIVDRKQQHSMDTNIHYCYKTNVKIQLDMNKRDYQLIEKIELLGNHNNNQEEGVTNNYDSKDNNYINDNITIRKVLFSNANMDVDHVDASYSYDMTLPTFPSIFVGTNQLLQFGIEHCIATSDYTRSRCFAFYGGYNQQLIRIVLCEEERYQQEPVKEEVDGRTTITSDMNNNKNNIKQNILLDMQSDVDRIVDKIIGNNNYNNPPSGPGIGIEKSKAGDQNIMITNNDSNPIKRLFQDSNNVGSINTNNNYNNDDINDKNNALTKHQMSLLEISSGVWVGDAIIRDIPAVATSPVLEQQQKLRKTKGFGSSSSLNKNNNNDFTSNTSSQITPTVAFGHWVVGVQKVAWRYMWNFGEEIRSITDLGKSLGSSIVYSDSSSSSNSLAGSVCINESLSRRIPKNDRMVYIDWEGDNVSFLVGSVSMQLPRHLKFDRTRQLRPFYTEFCVYQVAANSNRRSSNTDTDTDDDNMTAEELPQIVCSKISRIYNYEGRLKQGITSFFHLKRFGIDSD